jgi:hypothetical protein
MVTVGGGVYIVDMVREFEESSDRREFMERGFEE